MKQLCLALLLVLAALPAQAGTDFTGAWFTEGTENGVHFLMLIKNNPDGTFVKHIRAFDSCEDHRVDLEAGSWKVEGNRYIEITRMVDNRPVDSDNPYFNDVFDLSPDAAGHVVMTDEKDHIAWNMEHVADDFVIPQSGCTS